MTGKSKIFFLHGFWGTPFDFEPLQKYLNFNFQPREVELEQFSPHSGLKNFVDSFSAQAFKTPGPRYLVGYSMGGRLALQALMAHPESWAGAVILSAHPGLTTLEEKVARTHWQNQWAENFLTLNQEELEVKWHAQEVFQGSTPATKPKLTKERRHFLAEALKYWGPDQHLFGWEDLKNCKTPLLWCVGAEDHKYLELSRQMQEAKLPGAFVEIPHAGHRMIFDQPKVVAEKVVAFIGGRT